MTMLELIWNVLLQELGREENYAVTKLCFTVAHYDVDCNGKQHALINCIISICHESIAKLPYTIVVLLILWLMLWLIPSMYGFDSQI
jgi:hypothetical protein